MGLIQESVRVPRDVPGVIEEQNKPSKRNESEDFTPPVLDLSFFGTVQVLSAEIITPWADIIVVIRNPIEHPGYPAKLVVIAGDKFDGKWTEAVWEE